MFSPSLNGRSFHLERKISRRATTKCRWTLTNRRKTPSRRICGSRLPCSCSPSASSSSPFLFFIPFYQESSGPSSLRSSRSGPTTGWRANSETVMSPPQSRSSLSYSALSSPASSLCKTSFRAPARWSSFSEAMPHNGQSRAFSFDTQPSHATFKLSPAQLISKTQSAASRRSLAAYSPASSAIPSEPSPSSSSCFSSSFSSIVIERWPPPSLVLSYLSAKTRPQSYSKTYAAQSTPPRLADLSSPSFKLYSPVLPSGSWVLPIRCYGPSLQE